MLTNRLPCRRKNTVKERLTGTPGDWLLARYDTGRQPGPGRREPVSIQLFYSLKSGMEPGAFMRVTASDYGDTNRWWL
jgi:hypothetical protein